MKKTIAVSLLAIAAVLTACGTDTATNQDVSAPVASVENVEVKKAEVALDNGQYNVSWDLSVAGRAVDVLVSKSPDGSEAELIAEAVTETEFIWSPEKDLGSRHYFIVRPEVGTQRVVATRVLPLEGGRNFRDLGGYETADGRRIKWGKVYRSGVMSDLTASDYSYLSGLGIEVVCDLRSAEEREAEPTNWSAGNVEYLTFPDPTEGDMAGDFAKVFMDPELTPEKVTTVMTAMYSSILDQQKPAYKVMFDSLASGDLPMAFNCSAGKDRTGVGAALILTTLGVPREVVVQDYALSEQVVDYMEEFTGEGANVENSSYAFLAQLPPELLEPLMRSNPVYIETVLAEIEAEHGSVVDYVQSELDINATELEAIRNHLLEE